MAGWNKMKRIEYDFSDPKQAREFLSRLWVGDRHVEGVQLPSGWLDFNAMSDEQACIYATELCNKWLNVRGSKMRYREPELN